jgi:photosynthetic reaction center cytochrome c subunit
VPQYIWYNNPGPAAEGMAETQTGMAHPTQLVGDSALPYDPFTPFLEQGNNIRVQGTMALASKGLPNTNLSSMKQAELPARMVMPVFSAPATNRETTRGASLLRLIRPV